MALSKDKKTEVVSEVRDLLAESKLTVLAKYSGTSVKAMQELRREASQNQTKISVVKNRLFKKALSGVDRFKDIDTQLITGQLMYAFNAEDEAAPAQVLASFAKQQAQIEFVGAINAAGELLSAEDVKVLANLPSKEMLRAQLVGTLAAPLSGFVNVMSGNLRGVMYALNARAEQIK